jgi:hypothetical protein
MAESFGIFAISLLLLDIPRYQNKPARPRIREVPPMIRPILTFFFIARKGKE